MLHQYSESYSSQNLDNLNKYGRKCNREKSIKMPETIITGKNHIVYRAHLILY